MNFVENKVNTFYIAKYTKNRNFKIKNSKFLQFDVNSLKEIEEFIEFIQKYLTNQKLK